MPGRYILLLALALAACDGGMEPTVDAGELDLAADADGDGIDNLTEGAHLGADTDGDDTPDYLDGDSDGDGLDDAFEGDEDPDEDSQHNFRDLDSDGNGTPDAEDFLEDLDGDGTLDLYDLDDDGDLVRDAMERRVALAGGDSDGDGMPDDRDPDSDNDLVLDGHEFGADTDADGTLDVHDADSDDDGIDDRDEAGDDDVLSLPVDTDGDHIPDFRDRDSDNDGLLDADELGLGTDPTLEDSDGDGVSDLIETRAGTDPLDPSSAPLGRDDPVLVVPFVEPPGSDVLSVELGPSQPTGPSVVHLELEAIDREVTNWIASFEATPDARASCSARTSTTVRATDDGYADATRGDTLCWTLQAAENGTVQGDVDGPLFFVARAWVRVEGGTDIERRVYFVVPSPPFNPGP